MKLHPSLRPYREALFRLLYPSFCCLCRSDLELEESSVCAECRRTMEQSAYSPADAVSSLRFEFIDEAWALYPYESPAGEILSQVKFHGKQWLLSVFETSFSKMGSVLCSETDYDAIVPVPIDRLRLFEREFNQAELLAALVSRKTGLPVQRVLRKVRRTFTQSGLGKMERHINLFEAFRASGNHTGKKYLLIDDIFTTGATLEEAARTLKKNGAARVDALTAARTEAWKESAA